MRIFVKVKTKAKENKIERISENNYIISVKEAPIQNKANFAILRLFSDYFNIPLPSVRLVSGRNSKNKVIEINE